MTLNPLAPIAAGRVPAHVLPVIVEVRGTVQRISALITRALHTESDAAASLEHIRLVMTLLDQTSAALDFAGLDDVAALPQLMRRALLPVATATVSLSPALALALSRSLSALRCHFNAYATVAAHTLPALRLYPAYRDLAILAGESKVGTQGEAQGETEVSPAALLLLQIDTTVLIDMKPYQQAPDDNQRQQFEVALLHYLRAQSRHAQQSAAARMAAVMGGIAARQTDVNTQTGWQVLVAFAELAERDASVDIAAAKKIFSCAGRLIRHLGYTEVGKPPPMLVREALVAMARTKTLPPLARQIKLRFRLAQQMLLDFDVDYYGLSRHTALAALCTALDGSKRALDAAAADSAMLPALVPQLQALATAAAGMSPFVAVSAVLQRVAERLAGKNLSQHTALQLAVCLLHIEQFVTEPDDLVGVLTWAPGILNDLLSSLNKLAYQPGAHQVALQESACDDLARQDFTPPVDPSSPGPALSGASGVQWRSAVVALKATLIHTLASVESRLDDEINGAGGGTGAGLAEAMPALNRWLMQLSSALLILGEHDAAACAMQLRDMLVQRGEHQGAIDPDRVADQGAAVASQFVQLSTLIEAITCAPSGDHGQAISRSHRHSILQRIPMQRQPVSAELAAAMPRAQEALPQPAPGWLAESGRIVPSSSLPDSDGEDSAPTSSPLLAIYLDEAQQLIVQLDCLLGCWLDAPQTPLSTAAIHAAHSLAGSSATVGAQSLHELAAALEDILQVLADTGEAAPDALRPLLPEIIDTLKIMLTQLAQQETPQPQSQLADKLAALKTAIQPTVSHTCARGAADTGVKPVASISCAEWLPHQSAVQAPPPSTATEQDAGSDAAVDATEVTVAEIDATEVDATEVDATEVDAELRSIFIDEAADLLPQLGQQLRAWEKTPADTSLASGLLRILHTLKGSARMAGALDLGRRLHELEHAVNGLVHVDVIAVKAIASLLTDLDGIMHAYFTLAQTGVPDDAAASANDRRADTLTPAPLPADGVTTLPVVAPVMVAAGKPISPTLQLRVRADLLDRISSEAAELVVGSARLASELQQQRQAMAELTANMGRLRSQLRELDIEAETSMASQLAPAAVREFDPLEFDRFTRLQELSRMMTESMADVLSLQRSCVMRALYKPTFGGCA